MAPAFRPMSRPTDLVDPLHLLVPSAPSHVHHAPPGHDPDPARLLERGDKQAGQPVEFGITRPILDVGDGDQRAGRDRRVPCEK